MKLLFLIADGMGDWPLEGLGPEYDGRTPMELAATPAMDALARRGVVGRCRTVPQDMPPGSDVANMALLGFDPAKHHTGRGPIEAAAQGLELSPDDLVFRLNLVTVSDPTSDGFMRDYSSGHISTPKAAELIEDLKELTRDTPYELHPGVQYRHLLVRKGGANSVDARLDINPPHDITDKPIAEDLARYAACPEMNAFVQAAAKRLARPENTTKANAVWPWGQGRPLILPAFEEAFGLNGAVISAVDLVKGLGRAARMRVIDIPGATGLLDTNYEGKVEAALEFLKEGDFVYLHVEAPDECGHAGDAAEKIEAIERFDARIVAPLVQAMPDAAFLIACDHYTPIAVRTHVHDPVPFLLAAPGVTANSTVERLSEQSADGAGLMLDEGHELLSWCLQTLKRA